MRTTFFILILSILSAILNTGCQKEDVSTLEESLKGKEFINCEYGVILERSPYDSRVCKREYRYLNITFNDDYTYTAPIELFNYPYGWTIPSHESSGVWSIENGVLLIDGHIMYGYANTVIYYSETILERMCLNIQRVVFMWIQVQADFMTHQNTCRLFNVSEIYKRQK